MKLVFRNNKDFWAGLMFAGIGAGAMFVARTYPIGTTLRMGPGYYPSLLGVILVCFGLYIMVRGLRKVEMIKGHWSIRALIILPLSVVVFGVTMELAGFIPALFALIFVAAASGREYKFKEVLLLTVFLTILSVSMFVWGLGLPYQLIKGF
ncbi:MAG: tripartite tricarboxylate transporter TctB family protein [Proteobacteria bacterium]|nr:tripartite tricarboxylate transporter TctB family protein [Pseudomonadota bacterium]